MKLTVEPLTTIESEDELHVSEHGMRELSGHLDNICSVYLPHWFSPLWDTKQNDPYDTKTLPDGSVRPVCYSGKIAKRIAQYARQQGEKLTDAQIGEIGTLASLHKVSGQPVTYDITDSFDWKAGDFGDSGSCFWGSRSAARPALESAGALAVRFYNEFGRGIARAWLAPAGGRWVMFNSYAESGSWISQNGHTLSAMATFLSGVYDCKMQSCQLVNYGNGCGTLWVNDEKGIVLYTGETAPAYIDLEIDTGDQDGYHCDCCSDYVDEGNIYFVNDNALCEDCFNEYYFYCETCNENCHRDYLNETSDGEIMCEDCYNARYAKCDNCNKVCERNSLTDGLCEDCASQTQARCASCGERHLIDGTQTVCEEEVFEPVSRAFVECAGLLMVKCAHCDNPAAIIDCTKDGNDYYCPGCKGELWVRCSVCGAEAQQKNLHTQGHTHYCFDCQPALPGMSVKGIYNAN